MRDWSLLRVRALELIRDGWRSPSELARELHIGVEDARAMLNELEEQGEVFRDGHLAIAREGMR